MEHLGNAFYDIGCCAADELDTLVAAKAISIRMAYWLFRFWGSEA